MKHKENLTMCSAFVVFTLVTIHPTSFPALFPWRWEGRENGRTALSNITRRRLDKFEQTFSTAMIMHSARVWDATNIYVQNFIFVVFRNSWPVYTMAILNGNNTWKRDRAGRQPILLYLSFSSFSVMIILELIVFYSDKRISQKLKTLMHTANIANNWFCNI